MSWQDDLLKVRCEDKKKEDKLHITKEDTNGQESTWTLSTSGVDSGRSNNSISNGNSTSTSSNSIGCRSGDLFHRKISKEINNVTEKGGNGMITVEGALKDLEVIEKEAGDSGSKAVVKALKVVVKFLSTMRSNQLLTEEEKINIRKAKEARAAKETK